jgi:hypothetical protein
MSEREGSDADIFMIDLAAKTTIWLSTKDKFQGWMIMQSLSNRLKEHNNRIAYFNGQIR